MNVLDKHIVYFLGIGGIGMSALARYFHAQGKQVYGYDRTRTQLTEDLEDKGMSIHYEDDINNIPDAINKPSEVLVIYTPAIPKSHKEYNYLIDNGFEVFKRSQILGMITSNTFCMAIAGTHGKTTTTSILGHLLFECGVEMTAFLGGISENYNSNMIGDGDKVTVVEADEFDRSFLTLSPDIACITSMDADHLDVYGETEELKKSFRLFASRIKPDGKLLIAEHLDLNGIRVGFSEKAVYIAENIKVIEGSYEFDLVTPTGRIENIKFDLPGRHNVSNALLALAMAIEYGCAPYSLVSALASYRGVKRRFSVHIKSDELVYIDDYAHHPEEINAVYKAIKEFFPGKKILAVFQPHLYSRTRDFADEFALSLEQFDEIILLDIYPARELPISGVDSSWLLAKINSENKQLIQKKNLVESILKSKAQVVVTIGAGDIGEEVEKIKENLRVAS